MKRARFSEEQIVGILKEHEAGLLSKRRQLASTQNKQMSAMQPIGGSNSTVPQARIFDGAFLVAKVRIDQPIALG